MTQTAITPATVHGGYDIFFCDDTERTREKFIEFLLLLKSIHSFSFLQSAQRGKNRGLRIRTKHRDESTRSRDLCNLMYQIDGQTKALIAIPIHDALDEDGNTFGEKPFDL